MTWVIPDAYQKYGPGVASKAATPTDSPLPIVAGPSADNATRAQPWHPDSPLLWFAVIAAAAVGLMGASTHVRVGPASAGAAVGKD